MRDRRVEKSGVERVEVEEQGGLTGKDGDRVWESKESQEGEGRAGV